MSDIEKIKKLRQSTGAGFKDCSSALDESKGDLDKALELLRVKGIAKASKCNNYLVIGDQSFMHDVGSLQILAESDINLTIFILNNGGGAIFDQLPLSKKINSDIFDEFIRRNHNQSINPLVLNQMLMEKL